MARPLRVDVADGWYHITARGTDRRTIFTGDRERRHFLDLLEKMEERHGLRIHAYVLMGNHYHLLIQTPHANASSAMQWLQVSYSMWFNRRHDRVGPLFQGRFMSRPVEGDGSWALMASVYLHLNPIRVAGLGSGKRERKAEGRGMVTASGDKLRQRLKLLRNYRWSSYRAYAGYEQGPKWLTKDELLKRCGGRREYRHYVMEWATQGRDAAEFEDALERWALGTETFREHLRRLAKKISSEQPDRCHLQKRVSIAKIIDTVERVRGRKWADFAEEHGDIGRDMVLYLARQRSGLTLRQIGEETGGLGYKLVSIAVDRFSRRLDKDTEYSRLTQRCLTLL